MVPEPRLGLGCGWGAAEALQHSVRGVEGLRAGCRERTLLGKLGGRASVSALHLAPVPRSPSTSRACLEGSHVVTCGEWPGSPNRLPQLAVGESLRAGAVGCGLSSSLRSLPGQQLRAPKSQLVTAFLWLCPKRGDTAWDSSPSAAFGLAHELWEAREVKVTGSSPTLGVEVNLLCFPLRGQPYPCLVPS